MTPPQPTPHLTDSQIPQTKKNDGETEFIDYFSYRFDLEEMQKHQHEWRNELEARILLVEDFQKAINETITEQHDRVLHLSEIQNTTQATFQEAQSTIRNISSDVRRLRDDSRYEVTDALSHLYEGEADILCVTSFIKIPWQGSCIL